MEKVFQVFVSSTYSDLKDERRAVSETLSKAGYIAAGMELFPATDVQQLEHIKRVIDRSDYYIVIVGGRYGSLADENLSFTEKEFEYAVERGIPVLAMLHEKPDQITVAKSEKETNQIERLAKFRERLSKGRLVSFWNEASDLATKVLIAVAHEANLKPGVGWVRGDQAIDPKVLQEMEKFRIENEELKKRLGTFDENEVSFPEHLAGPNETLEFHVGRGYGDEPHTAHMTIHDIFAATFEHAIMEVLICPL